MLLPDEYKKHLDLKTLALSVNVCFDKYFVIMYLKKRMFRHCIALIEQKIIITLYDLVMSKVSLASDVLMIPLHIDTIYN